MRARKGVLEEENVIFIKGLKVQLGKEDPKLM